MDVQNVYPTHWFFNLKKYVLLLEQAQFRWDGGKMGGGPAVAAAAAVSLGHGLLRVVVQVSCCI